jgi:type II secretory pathway component PulK
MIRSAKDDDGSMLILTLWVVALLSLMAYSLMGRARLSIRQEQWQRLEHESATLVDSLAQLALKRYRGDETEGVDGYTDAWLNSFAESSTELLPAYPGATLNGEVYELQIAPSDEFGKINVNEASRELLAAIVAEAGVPDPEELASAIEDWRDADTAGAAESDYYADLEPHYAAANKPLARLEELLFVRGIRGGREVYFHGEDVNRNGVLDRNEDDGDTTWPPDNRDGLLQPGLVDLLTVFGDGSVNANSAPEPVLRALLSETELEEAEQDSLAKAILSGRRGPDGKDGEYDGATDDRPFETWEAIVEACAKALGDESPERARRVAGGLGVESGAARFSVSVRYPDRPFSAGGELLVTREDGEYAVREWHDW